MYLGQRHAADHQRQVHSSTYDGVEASEVAAAKRDSLKGEQHGLLKEITAGILMYVSCCSVTRTDVVNGILKLLNQARVPIC